MKIILQKYIAQSGLCSRRKATELILNKKVFVNDKIAEPGQTVSDNDILKVNGKIINTTKTPFKKIYIKLNKPVGYVCTNRKFEEENNVFELLPAELKEETSRLFVVGRLDKYSHGLVILTNDGDFAYKMTHPKFEVPKVYVVIVSSNVLQNDVDKILRMFKKGIDIGEGDGFAKAKEIKYLDNNKFQITLIQGKKRQIRRMFERTNYKVNDLKRISIGKYTLDGLETGKTSIIL